MKSTAEPSSAAPPVRVATLPAQVGPPRIAVSGETLAVLAAGEVRVGGTSVPIETPRGLGVRADGAFVVLDAPAAAPGQVRARAVGPAGEVGPDHLGAVSVPAAGRAFVLPARSPSQVTLVSWESRGAVSRVTFAGGRLVLEDFAPIAPRDPPCLAALGDGRWVRLEGGELCVRGEDGAETAHALPDEARGPIHLASAGDGRVFASLPSGDIAVLALDAAGPIDARPSSAPAAVAGRVATGLRVFHLASRGTQCAALLLEEDATRSVRRWSLVLVDGTRERWRVEITLPGPPEDTWVAVSPGRVWVGGERGTAAYDPESGRALG